MGRGRNGLTSKQAKDRKLARLKEKATALALPMNVERLISIDDVVKRYCGGSEEKFVEYLCYRVGSTEAERKTIEQFLYVYRQHDHKDLHQLLCELEIDPAKFYGWAAEGAFRYGQMKIHFQMADAAEKVVGANIRQAKQAKGTSDRELFMKAAGILPQARGTNINLQQNNLNQANADGDTPETSLPDFAADRRKIASSVREVELQVESDV